MTAVPRRAAWITAAVVIVVLLVLGWVVAFSPALGVRKIEVVGERRLSPAAIERAAAITAGTPLLRMPVAAVRSRVEALPDVASASVSASYPSTVVIRVTERVAVGYLTGTASAGTAQWKLVDRTGRPFRIVGTLPTTLPHLVPTPPGGVPTPPGGVPTPPGGVPTPPGGATGTDDTATLTALAQVGGALPASVLSRLAEIRASGPTRITLALRDGRSVFFGDAGRVADKARVLPGLLARPGTRFDVSNPELVVAQ